MPWVTGGQSTSLGTVSLGGGVGIEGGASLGKPLSAHPHCLPGPSRDTAARGSKTEFHSGNENWQAHSTGPPQARGRQPPWIPSCHPYCCSGGSCSVGPFLRRELEFGHKNRLGHSSCPFPAPAPLGPGNPMDPGEP